jgi:predicted PurR-regulated permease PerM
MKKLLPRSHRNNANSTNSVRPQEYIHLSQHKLWYLSLVLGLLFLFWLLKPVFAILAASAGIAYVLDPLVDRFEARGWSRDQGIAVIVAIGLLITTVALLLFIPPVVVQFGKLSEDIRHVIANLDVNIQQLTLWIEHKTGQQIDIDLKHVQESLPQWLEETTANWQGKAMSIVEGLFLRGMGLVNTLLNLLLLPIFTYYLLRDWDELMKRSFELLPHKTRPLAQKTMLEVDERLNAFILGQIKVCLALAVLYSFGLWIVGIELAFPIGIASGLLFIIPYVGTVFGIVTAGLMALINFGFDWHILGVLAVFGLSQTVEGYYLTPKIVGESVGLSPLVVMIALIVGAAFMGIWGMFLAIPVTAVLSVLAAEWLRRYKTSDTFLESANIEKPQ